MDALFTVRRWYAEFTARRWFAVFTVRDSYVTGSGGDADALLLEDGFYLLLEDGASKLSLE